MKKNLRFMFTALLMMFGMTAMAQKTVTLDFNEDIATLFPTFTEYSSGSGSDYNPAGEFNETTTTTAVDGVTATVTASDPEKSTRNRLWATAPRLRMYDGAITFTSAGDKITKMVITRSTNKSLIANQNTVDAGSLTTSDQQNNAEITWTGEVQSVTITIAGNTQFSKVVLTLGGEAGVAAPTITPNGGEFEESVEVSISAAEGATIKYALGDAAFQTYSAPFTLNETTTVKAYAEQGGKQSETVTATFTKKEVQQIQKINVAQALEIIAGLGDGKKTENEYDVEGYIVVVDEWSPKPDGYGNATFQINDEAGNTTNTLTVFRAKNAEGGNFTTEDTPLAVGEKVTVRGLLQKYVKDGVTTPEVAQYGKVIARNTPTAISSVKAACEQGVVYNLQGQQVMQPTKGLYIINGKKVVIK